MTDEQMAYLEGESRDYWRARAEAAECRYNDLAQQLIDAQRDNSWQGVSWWLHKTAAELVATGRHCSKEDTNASGATETRRVPRRLPTEPACPKTPHGGDSEATGHATVRTATHMIAAQTLEEVAELVSDTHVRDTILDAIRAWRAAQ